MQTITFLDKNNINRFDSVLKEKLTGFFPSGSRVAVKLHMGEEGNKYFLKPEWAKKIVNILKHLGLKPFLFDSPVIYGGQRDSSAKYYKTAEKHGFSEKSIGCPVIVSDDGVDVKTYNLNAQVCKPIYESVYMLVLSHVKGHSCSGFGAAIKNLGMGGTSKKTKADIVVFPELSITGYSPQDLLLKESFI